MLHDHGKTGGADQSGAVLQLCRLDLGGAMALLRLLSGPKDDGTLRQLLKHGRGKLVPGAGHAAADHIHGKVKSIDQVGQCDSEGSSGCSKDVPGRRISSLRASVYGPRT